MNVAEYIATGILESYVLDQLSDLERKEVKKMAIDHPEIAGEIEKIELGIEALALKAAVNPPHAIRQKIVSKVSEKEAPLISINKKGSSALKYAAAASLFLAIASCIAALNFFTKWKSVESRLAQVIAENRQFADNYNQVNQQLDNIQQAVVIMNNAAFIRVVMNSTENAPGSLATIYWNKTTEDVYLSIQNLKELSQDQQYQLWAIIDGKPVNAGVFDSENSAFLVQMKSIAAGAAAFAVTIEPQGGSESPSLETMQVLGNV